MVLELQLILKIVIARLATHYLVVLPVLEDAGHVLARNASHGGEIALPDLLTDHNPARPDFMPKMFRHLEQRVGDPAFERKETTGRHQRVCRAGVEREG